MESKQNGEQKAGLSSQNTAKLANLDMGHPPESSLGIIFLGCQIFGTTICKIRRENCRDPPPKRAQIFVLLNIQLMNMHETCPNMGNLHPMSIRF